MAKSILIIIRKKFKVHTGGYTLRVSSSTEGYNTMITMMMIMMRIVIIPYIYIVLYIFSNAFERIISFILHHLSPIILCFISGET